MTKHGNTKGFTLIELILYVALMGIVLYTASLLYTLFLAEDARDYARAEVEQSSQHALLYMTQTIRNAPSVTTPAAGSNAAALQLTVDDESKSPTVFSLSQGSIVVAEGGSPAVALLPSSVVVDSLEFENRGSEGSLYIEFSAHYRNDSERPEFDYEQTFYASATIR